MRAVILPFKLSSLLQRVILLFFSTSIILTANVGTYTSLIPVSSIGHVQHGIHNISEIIAPELLAKHFDVKNDLLKIDKFVSELSSEKENKKMGNEERLGVSIAVAKAGTDGLVRLFSSTLTLFYL